jgi:hypothetical protein
LKDYKGKSLAGKAKEFVKTVAKQNSRSKKIAKGISGGQKNRTGFRNGGNNGK